ncbi:TonB-dependent receptor [Aestuariicella hydrocarbonica]|uniref:TonB-dependent receptor n=1 Tax=Pseudomaricurvus hydrocarbonicus TaxID=1470433 RepID=A0A9E5MQB1_9GAMM|nr:TonB-dependent receptor [Aestuariicella hydrocarbonica]NHO68377.1 TonB-dependent receptor [Aestuariicella hydrocarbonica]
MSLAISASALCSTFLSGITEAQIEEVVVTAQQREQSLQDVPISISAFNGEAIDKNMFKDVSGYVTKTPNASFTSSGSRSRREISIRGVTNFVGQNTALRTSTFGFYVDGFNMAGSSINPPVMDIQQIEILRGPQATYFGRNALGGGISVTSNQPEFELGGSFSADLARFNSTDLTGMLNVPIIDDVLAARFNVKTQSSDGNIENINEIGGGNDSDYDYAKATILFTPTDDLSVTVTGSYAEEEVGMREGVPSGVFSTFAGATLFSDFPDTDGDGLANPDPDGVGFFPNNTDKVNFNSPQSVGTDFEYLVARVDYDMESTMFTSITGYVESDFYLEGDIDGGSVDYLNEYRSIPRRSFSQELRLQSVSGQTFDWNVGVIYGKDSGKYLSETLIGAAELFGLAEDTTISKNDSEQTSKSWALFGQVDYYLTDALTLSVGGRYSEETITSSIKRANGAFIQTLESEDTFYDFSPRVAINYIVSEDVSVYATASKGFKSGGVQVSPLPGTESYEPEVLWNYEAGVKAELMENRLRVNAAAFYMDWKDLQTSFQQSGVDSDGNFTLFTGIDNAERAISKGVEMTATFLPNDSLQIDLGVGYLDAKYDKFVAYIDGANRVLDGETVPNSPKITASLDIEYGFELSENWSGYVRTEWQYRDSIQSSTSSLIQSGYPWEVPSYDVLNLRAGFENNNLSIVAYVENALDDDHFVSSYQKAFMGGMYVEPSYMNYGVKATYSF